MHYRRAGALASTAFLILAAAGAACGGGDGATEKSPTAAGSMVSVASPTKPAARPTQAVATSIAAAPSASSASPTSAVPALIPTPEPALPTPVPVIPTPAPVPTEPPPHPPPAGNQSVTIAGVDSTFSVTSLSLPAGATVTITFDNQDAGVIHDIEIYDPSAAVIAATDLAEGPIVQTLVFTLGGPGNYSFKCSVHPQTMRGFIKVL